MITNDMGSPVVFALLDTIIFFTPKLSAIRS